MRSRTPPWIARASRKRPYSPTLTKVRTELATFMATTASNGPRLKDPAAAKQVLDRFYWECDVEAVIREEPEDGQAHLYVYGYDWPAAWKMPEGVSRSDFQPDYDVDDGFE